MRNKGTKIRLSKEELELLENTGFFTAKTKLTEHLIDILSQTREYYRAELQSFSNKLPPEILKAPGKISKGENYLGLPYLVLDFPAVFEKEGVFAFRTMFWWGHPISVTFHISGKYLNKIPDSFCLNSNEKDVFIGINKNQWVHHFENFNYESFIEFQKRNLELKAHAFVNNFLKMAIQISNSNAHQLPETGTAFIKNILIKIN